jgi:YVTN family beta-propeller protein
MPSASYRRGALAIVLPLLLAGGGAALIAPRLAERKVGEVGPDGGVLVSTNQIITPAGVVQKVEGARPKDLALSPDGKTLAILAQNQVLLYNTNSPDTAPVAIKISAAAPLGIAWAPDGSAVYASLSKAQVAQIAGDASGAWKLANTLTLDFVAADGAPDVAAGTAGQGRATGDPQVNGLAIAPDGKTLYAALGIRNQVAVVSLPDGKVTKLIPVQAAPYNVALSPDGSILCVANRGGKIAEDGELSAPSAGTKIRVDPKTDAALSGSVSLIDTKALTAVHIPTGRQPAGMAFAPDGKTVYVASSDDDTVHVLDPVNKKLTRTISLHPKSDPGFGQIPTDVAVSADGKTLYASCGGANAVAVVEAKSGKMVGHIPTGWFPAAVAERDGALFVASSKGFGSRTPRKPDVYAVHSTQGTVQLIAATELSKQQLGVLSAQVAQNNRWSFGELPARAKQEAVPVPARVGEPSVFKHVVYIIKENHTYDSMFGDIPNGNGDKSLCMFGEEASPNHHELARQYVLMDNTYTSGTNSADGHQWTSASAGNGYIEQNYSAHTRSYPYDGGDPLAYSPAGFLWNAAVAQKKTVRVYGEFVNKPSVVNKTTGKKGASWAALWADYQKGMPSYEITSDTDNAALKPLLHPHYIGFPSSVPDQWRADQFIVDVDGFAKTGKMPDLCIMLLPNDHTMGTTPGNPTPRATVADNDLALGRIVERLTKSPFWKEMLILVIEDDSQLGVDHVDGHRTVALCISPYTKRGAVVSDTYNHTSFLRTMGLVLGFPALNRFDRTATPLTSCFIKTPDFTTYTHLANKIPLDELNPRLTSLTDPETRRLAQACADLDWSDVDRADASVVTRAVWRAQMPGKPFPTHAYHALEDDDDEEEEAEEANKSAAKSAPKKKEAKDEDDD